MAEDLGVGFVFFENENGEVIANDNAVRNVSDQLFRGSANENAYIHIETATEAVQGAAQKKADVGRSVEIDDTDAFTFTDDGDFLL